MLELRIHGRGGQGSVVAAYLLATAAHETGLQCQAFPSFGAERRGAPVASFVRIAERPIRRRCQVREPHFVIVQDPGLLRAVAVTAGLRPGGGALLDAPAVPEELELPEAGDAVAFGASELATEMLGRPLPNVALLAAFLTLTELLPLESLEAALAERFAGETLDRNRQLLGKAAGAVAPGRWKEAARAAL